MELENKEEVKREKLVVSNMISSSPKVSIHSEGIASNSNELPKRIIVPLDGSDFSFRAAWYAISLAKLTGGEIICVHAVVDLPYIDYMVPSVLTVPRYIHEAKKQTEEWFSQVKSKAAKEGVRIITETIFSPQPVAESI